MYPSRIAWGMLACIPLLCATPLFPGQVARAEGIGQPLSLQEALRRTRAAHPALTASQRDVGAARSREREARRRPAPSLLAEYENFGADLGTGRADATLTAQQTFELGGDRGARRGLSASHTAIASAEHEQLVLALESVTVEAFAEAWQAQERAVRWRGAVSDAAAAAAAAAERLRVGAAPAHEVARARANHALRRIELEREERLLAAARERLAAQWRGNADSIGVLALPDPLTIEPASWAVLEAAATSQPSMRRALAERKREVEQSKWLRAQHVPDVTVGAGARHLSELSATGFVLSLSMALPGPGTGPDAIAAADTAHAASTARTEAERERQLVRIRGVQARLAGALASIRDLREEVVPAAEDAVRGLASGFRSGGLTYVEMLEGQRALLEAHALGIELTREAWVAAMELERWTSAASGGGSR